MLENAGGCRKELYSKFRAPPTAPPAPLLNELPVPSYDARVVVVHPLLIGYHQEILVQLPAPLL